MLVFPFKDIDDDSDAGLEDSDEDEYEGNKDAARALLRVKQKLDGYEDGEMRSVHGQVLLQLSISTMYAEYFFDFPFHIEVNNSKKKTSEISVIYLH